MIGYILLGACVAVVAWLCLTLPPDDERQDR